MGIEFILAHLEDPWWTEPIVLTAGILRDATQLVEKVYEQVQRRPSDDVYLLLGRCLTYLTVVHRLRGAPGVRRFQVHQASVDTIEILVEASDEGVDEAWLESRRQEFQEHAGSDIRLCLKKVKQIPPTPAGKLLFTTSEVPVSLDGETILTHG